MKLKEYYFNNIRVLKLLFFFLVSIVAIVYLFPLEGKFKYEFQKGRPWMHDVLVAPFDFPIYKSEDILQTERDTLLKDFQPYFTMDSTVFLNISNNYSEIFNKNWNVYTEYIDSLGIDAFKKYSLQHHKDSVRKKYFVNIRNSLENIYLKGIVSDTKILQNINSGEGMINVVSGQEVTQKQAGLVYTQKSSYEDMKASLDVLSKKLQPDLRIEHRFGNFFELLDLIEPNLFYDIDFSEKIKNSILEDISLTEGMIHQGEKIIAIGEPVNEEKFQVLQSLKREYETNPAVSRNGNLILLGQIILVAFAFVVLYLFLFNFRKEVLSSGKKTFFILMLVVMLALLTTLTIRADSLSVYVVPFVILPILIKTFYDERIALFVHIITILLIGFWVPNGFEFVFLNFIAGAVTIFALRNLYRRGILFFAAMFALLSYSLIYTGMSILQEGKIQDIDVENYAWFAGNALLVLTSYPLIYIFERLFGFISDATLVELSDTNQPLLRKLAEKAPGTFQHSLQVANLAEEMALQVGANTLLVRTGSLYHDIGKMDDPMYFIENLTTNYNPHDHLSFEESATKIIGHVARGVEIAKKKKLPEAVIDFIRTHHGTMTVQYFYKSFLKEYPDSQVDINKFTYPGPTPHSKETAIVMMADSTEAASRSLKVINKDVINALVDSIIDHQLSENQFDDVDLTLRDFKMIRGILKKKLINIYHARIEYPK